jgi:RimJ/RimL family protein N-acetyltransferase
MTSSELIELRPYYESEFDLACQIRGIENPESKIRFEKAFKNSGQWVDEYFHLALVIDEKLIGDLQLRHCDRTMPPGVLHVGIDISGEERGKGFGTQALNLASNWAFQNGYHRIEGSTEVENIAMKRAFEKANWTFEGTLHNLFKVDGIGRDYLSFAKTIL